MNEAGIGSPRRAIEALRAGVPNRDAAAALPLYQDELVNKFLEMMSDVESAETLDETPSKTLTISGGFGSGKSHLLEYLEHIALEQGFVCSHVVISKETPLYDPSKLARAAIEAAKLPGAAGKAVTELVEKRDFDEARLRELMDWSAIQDANGCRFGAMLRLLDSDDEIREHIAWEWSGYPATVTSLKSAMKSSGGVQIPISSLKLMNLGPGLWQFLPRFFKTAGYKGWVVLIDEVELMLRYSKLQRAKSYAQAARLTASTKKLTCAGLITVFTCSDDFEVTAEDVKGDAGIPDWLRERKNYDPLLAKDAESGFKMLKRGKMLRRMRAEEMTELENRIRELHSQAFDWNAPVLDHKRLHLASSSIRERIKSWITEWDIRLQYPDYDPDVVAESVQMDYNEDDGLEECAPADW